MEQNSMKTFWRPPNRDSPKLHKCYFFYMCKQIFSKVTMSDQIGPLVTIMSFFLYWESRFQDRHTTVGQLQKDCLMMSAKRLPKDCQKTAWRQPEYCLMTAQRPPENHRKTAWRPPEDHQKTTRQPSEDRQKAARWLPYNYLNTDRQPTEDFLKTN